MQEQPFHITLNREGNTVYKILQLLSHVDALLIELSCRRESPITVVVFDVCAGDKTMVYFI
jgi:hypothetical protein